MSVVRLISIIVSMLMVASCQASNNVCPEIDSTVKLLMSQARVQKGTVPLYAFELERLGEKAVPFIVKYMDDRTSLPPQTTVPIRNRSPQAFEEYAWYTGAEKAVDMFSAVLTNITGRSFRHIYLGATDEARDEEVAAWHRFIQDEFLRSNPAACHP